jgi:hypothetical protein
MWALDQPTRVGVAAQVGPAGPSPEPASAFAVDSGSAIEWVIAFFSSSFRRDGAELAACPHPYGAGPSQGMIGTAVMLFLGEPSMIRSL